MSTRAPWISKLVRWSASSMTTSGAPFLADTAVWNLSYSGPPAPAFRQQACTSLWVELKLSTTFAMFGYQAQTVTVGALFTFSLLVQSVACSTLPPLLPPSVPEPPAGEQPTRAASTLPAATAASTSRDFFTVFSLERTCTSQGNVHVSVVAGARASRSPDGARTVAERSPDRFP